MAANHNIDNCNNVKRAYTVNNLQICLVLFCNNMLKQLTNICTK